MTRTTLEKTTAAEVSIPLGAERIAGDLVVPDGATALVLFAHGSGSGRFSSRNRFVARSLNADGLATLLLDLLTPGEEHRDQVTRQHRFDIPLLSGRVVDAVDWCRLDARTKTLRIGLFGASTGAAAALNAAAARPDNVGAVVSRGGRPDLALATLDRVRSPTLLIVGGLDFEVIELNKLALEKLRCEKNLALVHGASHLFEEPGAIDRVCTLASNWFAQYLVPSTTPLGRNS